MGIYFLFNVYFVYIPLTHTIFKKTSAFRTENPPKSHANTQNTHTKHTPTHSIVVYNFETDRESARDGENKMGLNG